MVTEENTKANKPIGHLTMEERLGVVLLSVAAGWIAFAWAERLVAVGGLVVPVAASVVAAFGFGWFAGRTVSVLQALGQGIPREELGRVTWRAIVWRWESWGAAVLFVVGVWHHLHGNRLEAASMAWLAAALVASVRVAIVGELCLDWREKREARVEAPLRREKWVGVPWHLVGFFLLVVSVLMTPWVASGLNEVIEVCEARGADPYDGDDCWEAAEWVEASRARVAAAVSVGAMGLGVLFAWRFR